MARPRKLWYRFYLETLDDTKIRSLPKNDRWIWPVVMGLAKESPEEGKLLLKGVGLPVTDALIADKAGPGYTAREVAAALQRFAERGMLHRDGGVWVVTNFRDRQYSSDTSADRMADSRDRQHADCDGETPGDCDNETPSQPPANVTAKGRRSSHARTTEGRDQSTESREQSPESGGATGDSGDKGLSEPGGALARARSFAAAPKPSLAPEVRTARQATEAWLIGEFHGDSKPNAAERRQIEGAAALFVESRVDLDELPRLFAEAHERWDPDGIDVTPMGVARNVTTLRKPAGARRNGKAGHLRANAHDLRELIHGQESA